MTARRTVIVGLLLGILVVGIGMAMRASRSRKPVVLQAQNLPSITASHGTVQPTSKSPPADHRIELSDLAARTQRELPTQDQVAASISSDEEAHHAPAALLRGADRIGDFSQALADDLGRASGAADGRREQLVAQGLEFYRECVERDELPDSLRAVCYRKFAELATREGRAREVLALKAPRSVVEIASSIASGPARRK